MRKQLSAIALAITLGTGAAALGAGPSGAATIASNLSFSCLPSNPTTGFHHLSGQGYWAETTIGCTQDYKFTVMIKQNGVVLPGLTRTFGPYSPQTNPTVKAFSAKIPVVDNANYQTVVTVVSASPLNNGGSLGYMTSGTPQVLIVANPNPYDTPRAEAADRVDASPLWFHRIRRLLRDGRRAGIRKYMAFRGLPMPTGQAVRITTPTQTHRGVRWCSGGLRPPGTSVSAWATVR